MKPEHPDNKSESELKRKLREHESKQQSNQPPTPPGTPDPPPPKPQRPPAEQVTLPTMRTTKLPPLEAPPAPNKKKKSTRKRTGLYLPWWSLVLIFLMLATVTCGVWTLIFTAPRPTVPLGGLTPTFLVITNTATIGAPGQIQNEPLIITATIDPSLQEAAPVQTAIPQIEVGGFITIIGTEGEGVAIRQGPGLQYSFFFIGQDGEEFLVADGPREGNDFVWWFIADPDIPDKIGWAVQDFMEAVPRQPLQQITVTPEQES